MITAQVAQADREAIQAALAAPPPRELQGICAGCGKGIPVGYLPLVTKWHSVVVNGYGPPLRVNKPTEMWCKECGDKICESGAARKHRTPANEREQILETMKNMPKGTPPALTKKLSARAKALGVDTDEFDDKHGIAVLDNPDEMEPKTVAARLLSVMSNSEPHSSKWLAKKARLEYTDVIKPILKKLRDVGKVDFKKLNDSEGGWVTR